MGRMNGYHDQVCWKQAFQLQQRGVEAWLHATQLESVAKCKIPMKRQDAVRVSVSDYGVVVVLADNSMLIFDLKLRQIGTMSISTTPSKGKVRVELRGPFIVLHGPGCVRFYSFAGDQLATFDVHPCNVSPNPISKSQQQLEENFMLLQTPDGNIQEVSWDYRDAKTVHTGPVYLSGIDNADALHVCGDQQHVLGSYFVRPNQCILICWERGNPTPLWTFSKITVGSYGPGSVDLLGPVLLFGTFNMNPQMHLLDVKTSTVLSELSTSNASFLLTPGTRAQVLSALEGEHKSLVSLPPIALYPVGRTRNISAFFPANLELRAVVVDKYKLDCMNGSSTTISLYFDGVMLQYNDKALTIQNLEARTSVAVIPLRGTDSATPTCAISNNRELLAMIKSDGVLELFHPMGGEVSKWKLFV